MKRIYFITCLTALFALMSCSDDAEDLALDEEQTQEEGQNNESSEEGDFTSAEVQSILEMDETTSMFDTILSDLYFDNGTSNKSNDDCYSVEYFENGFVAQFNNCVLNETENINGTLNVSYGVGESSTTFTATFSDFFIGTIKVNGTRAYTLTVTEEETVSFEINSNINLEYEDDSVISESGTKVLAFIFEEGQDTLWNLQGTWTYQKDGNTYTIGGNVSKGLTCEYWSQGTMNISVNDLVVDIDFGDGTCDDQAVLTYPNGATQNITL
ncbi:MAG: hypothetical protein AAGC45_13590 [Bacteroidota bacterium]